MNIFVVIIEGYHGGGDKLRVFRNKNDALDYQGNLNKESVIETFVGDYPEGKVFVIVSEEWYGGNGPKVFSTKRGAEKYLKSLEPEFIGHQNMILDMILEHIIE